MAPSIKQLIADTTCVAITFRRALEPLEGRDVAIFPPTYPAGRTTKTHRFDTPYPVNETKGGMRICDLDSTQSQANRMEAAFTAALGEVVPHHVVEAGGRRVELLALPHRIADAAIRATGLGAHIRTCFESIESGDAVPMARIAPTSLVYGAWDSRDTRIGVPRAVRSEICAHDVSVLTRSVRYSGAFGQEALGLTDREWAKGAGAGFAMTPSVDRPGGVLVHGDIVHSASILVHVLRTYRTGAGSEVLAAYLLGLALGGLLHAGRDYHLRSGCTLVPAEAGRWQVVRSDGAREAIEIDACRAERELRAAARAWAEAAGVELGGAPAVHAFDADAARSKMTGSSGKAAR